MKCMLFTVLVLVLVGCGGDDCTRESYVESVQPILDRYAQLNNDSKIMLDDDVTLEMKIPVLADSTNLISALDKYDAPGCAVQVHRRLENSIMLAHQGFFEWLDDDLDAATRLLSRSTDELHEWTDMLDDLP